MIHHNILYTPCNETSWMGVGFNSTLNQVTINMTHFCLESKPQFCCMADLILTWPTWVRVQSNQLIDADLRETHELSTMLLWCLVKKYIVHRQQLQATLSGATQNRLTPSSVSGSYLAPSVASQSRLTPTGASQGRLTPSGVSQSHLTPSGATHGRLTPSSAYQGRLTPSGASQSRLTSSDVSRGRLTPSGTFHRHLTPSDASQTRTYEWFPSFMSFEDQLWSGWPPTWRKFMNSSLKTAGGNNWRSFSALWCLLELPPTNFVARVENETISGKICAPLLRET